MSFGGMTIFNEAPFGSGELTAMVHRMVVHHHQPGDRWCLHPVEFHFLQQLRRRHRAKLCEAFAEVPFVPARDCRRVSDFLQMFRIITYSIDHLEKLVERLRRDPNIVRTRTLIILSTLLDRA